MIKEGKRTNAKYWGTYTVKKIVKLEQPVMCHSKETGEAEFMPTIIRIEWDEPPSSDVNEYWFPYWMKIRGKEKYGQFAPMLGANALLQLMQEAIKQDFFSEDFMRELSKSLEEKLRESGTGSGRGLSG